MRSILYISYATGSRSDEGSQVQAHLCEGMGAVEMDQILHDGDMEASYRDSFIPYNITSISIIVRYPI